MNLGLTRFPFTNFEANANWLLTVAMVGDLVRWFQLLCLEGRWRDARPKASLGDLSRPGTRRAWCTTRRRSSSRGLANDTTTTQRLSTYFFTHLTRPTFTSALPTRTSLRLVAVRESFCMVKIRVENPRGPSPAVRSSPNDVGHSKTEEATVHSPFMNDRG